VQVLQDVSVDIKPGEFVAIEGRSGSGKSTLLHLMGALDEPDAGTVEFDGRNIGSLSSADRSVIRNKHFGFVFQFYHLLPELNVLQNAILPAMVGVGRFGWSRIASDVRTRASQLVVLGVLAAVGGAAYIVAASYVDRESANALLGAGYLGLYMLMNGSYPIVQKHVLSTLDYSPLLVTTWTYLVGTLLILMSAVTAAPPAAEWALTPTGTAGVLFSGVLSTFFNYSAMSWVNQRTTGVFVSSFFPLQSFLTPLLAALTLGARIFPADYAGGVVIMFGLGCCTAAQLLQQQQQQQQEDREEEEGGGRRARRSWDRADRPAKGGFATFPCR
jgi:ABC-type Fe3+/spermidine/putrescine transport system ATPase subunit